VLLNNEGGTLTTIVKFGIGAGVIALLVWGSKDRLKKLLSDFQIDITGYGKPTLNGPVLTVPLQLKFTNPTPLPITLDSFVADVYLEKNGQFIPAAKINQPISIQPGVTTQWLLPAVDLQKIFGGSLLNTLTAAQQIIVTKKFKIRSDVSAVYHGVPIPDQSFTNVIDI
jgi:hypothetical protein